MSHVIDMFSNARFLTYAPNLAISTTVHHCSCTPEMLGCCRTWFVLVASRALTTVLIASSK